MRITVLGATGGTGVHVVRQALDDGHDVTAVVRDPKRLAVEPHSRLTVVTGSATDTADLAEHLRDRDAVISALGSRTKGPTTVTADGARAACAAIRKTGGGRFVVVSASGAFTDGDSLPVRLLVKPLLGRVLRHEFDDMRAMEAIVRDSAEVDWTIVRPPRLTEGTRTGTVATRTDGNVRGAFTISRADLAAYLLTAAASPSLSRATVSVAGGR
ncbi:NADH-flavin reductase [Saccharomonospora sp. CUA-673]|uniref:NAD(P)-dependent oxidoreductase n=1 Tax=Saccharomonospora sp. CUA-673 TaxID=1904969 RepID=UPI00096407C2|nr:NAD(P)H-binding protein [Saccharomonospora sp. CUA-673]OLT49001.1 NADH-flavin reductase [Saccharomonospora sp. CUA-673]